VDIRSDLYSLGVTLWLMVTGQIPFRGPSADVMYQHQHTLLPLELLKDVPQPVVVLLEQLLEEDPAQRFQTPGTRKPPAKQGPKKISVARLPVTGSDQFGREEDIACLGDAWANKDVKRCYDRCLGRCGEVHTR